MEEIKIGESYRCPICEKQFVLKKGEVFLRKKQPTCSWKCFYDSVWKNLNVLPPIETVSSEVEVAVRVEKKKRGRPPKNRSVEKIETPPTSIKKRRGRPPKNLTPKKLF